MTKPTHIAFILDGNGRWATKRMLPRNLGHKQGIKAIAETLKALKGQQIPYASFFCFSTENWHRSKDEVDGIMRLAESYFSKSIKFFLENDISAEFFGDLTKLPPELQTQLKKVKNETANCKSLKAGFCINYGGKEDILHAVNKLIESGEKHITAQQISHNLYTSTFPDPDLMIRTSGEQRLSNFQLWQLSYTELYFPKVLWPDFNEKHLIKSLKVFALRKRRFGGN